jgi:Ca2+-binding RTX toxin-like protein
MAKKAGTSDDDELTGSSSNDSFTASSGNDVMRGLNGIDRVIYNQKISNYKIKYLNGTIYIIKPDNTFDELYDIEQIQFGNDIFQLTEDHLSDFPVENTRPIEFFINNDATYFLSTSAVMSNSLILDILEQDLTTKHQIDLSRTHDVYGANFFKLGSGETLIVYGGENKISFAKISSNLTYTHLAEIDATYPGSIAWGGIYNGLNILKADSTEITLAIATTVSGDLDIFSIDANSFAINKVTHTGESGVETIVLDNGNYAIIGEATLAVANSSMDIIKTTPLKESEYLFQSCYSSISLQGSNFLVSWVGYKNLPDRQEGYVTGEIFTADGTLVTKFSINADPENSALWSDVCELEDGSLAFVWTSNADGSGLGVYGRIFDSSGNAITDTIQVNSITAGNQTRPHILADKSGGFTVYWNDETNGGAFQRFDNEGNPNLISITGTTKADIIFADDGDQQILGGDGNDQISSGIGDDILLGGNGNDVLIPGDGNDIIEGGLGTNAVDYSSITASVTVNLNSGKVVFTDYEQTISDIQNLIASQFDDTIIGSSNANDIRGGAGSDRIEGNGGKDTLYGGAGNDTINGGDYHDVMVGGLGNDVYIVDQSIDTVTEKSGEGVDTIQTSISIFSITKLSAIDNLTYTGTSAAQLTGNALSNVITGSSGNDKIDGFLGADIMIGAQGNDAYIVDNILDSVAENSNEGLDSVTSSVTFTLPNDVENLTLAGSNSVNGIGNILDNLLVGNAKLNTLLGGDGADTVDGGAGNDLLTGGDGMDYFRFTTVIGKTNIDTVTDFVLGTDKLQLDATIFKKFVGTIGSINAGNFVSGSSGIKPIDANDYLIFNTSTGGLYYDSDGSGKIAMVQFATITGVSNLSSADFCVI